MPNHLRNQVKIESEVMSLTGCTRPMARNAMKELRVDITKQTALTEGQKHILHTIKIPKDQPEPVVDFLTIADYVKKHRNELELMLRQEAITTLINKFFNGVNSKGTRTTASKFLTTIKSRRIPRGPAASNVRVLANALIDVMRQLNIVVPDNLQQLAEK